MANEKCPECGVSLDERDPAKHARSHYPDFIPPYPQNMEARKRQAFLLDLSAKRKKAKAQETPE